MEKLIKVWKRISSGDFMANIAKGAIAGQKYISEGGLRNVSTYYV